MSTPDLSAAYCAHLYVPGTDAGPDGTPFSKQTAFGQCTGIRLRARDGLKVVLRQRIYKRLAVGVPQRVPAIFKVFDRGDLDCCTRVENGDLIGDIQRQIDIMGDQ
jgi:hypothetical protein